MSSDHPNSIPPGWRMAISISITDEGGPDKPALEAVHMLMFHDTIKSEEQVKDCRLLLVKMAEQMGFGVYKTEHPREVP